jgi:hypothetical protein
MTVDGTEAEIRKLLPAEPRYGQRVRVAYLRPSSPFRPRETSSLYVRDVSYDWNGREWLAERDAPAEWPRRIRP